MTEAQTTLARRAVACKGFRWVRGMLRHDGYRYVGSGLWARWSDTALSSGVLTALHMPEQYPDLTDAATVGCLLALVREAWSDPFLCAVGDPDTGWRIDAVTAQVQDLHGYASEAEALVFALERLP